VLCAVGGVACESTAVTSSVGDVELLVRMMKVPASAITASRQSATKSRRFIDAVHFRNDHCGDAYHRHGVCARPDTPLVTPLPCFSFRLFSASEVLRQEVLASAALLFYRPFLMFFPR